jgi:type I restriction enzyme S subunit
VQREIVRVLDQFTQLEAELEAELEARRRQYEHYRDQLLTFREAAGVRWIPMGEIGMFIRGRRFTKNDMVPAGIPSIHYGEIYTHYGVTANETVGHVREDLAGGLRYAKPGDVLIAGVGETVEDVAKAVAWLGDDSVAIHDDSFAFRSEQDPTYISYVMQTAAFQWQKEKHVSRAKVKRIGSDGLGQMIIPIPPLEEQERIVAILNQFDALVNDLNVGLPAELAARRKQYEYYRDRLLTFEGSAA